MVISCSQAALRNEKLCYLLSREYCIVSAFPSTIATASLKKLPLSKDIYFARIMNEPEIFFYLLSIYEKIP